MLASLWPLFSAKVQKALGLSKLLLSYTVKRHSSSRLQKHNSQDNVALKLARISQ